MTFAAVALPELRSEPEFGDGWVKFVPDLRRAHRGACAAPCEPPPVRPAPAPLVWTTLGLTVWTPTVGSNTKSSGRADSPATGSTTTTAHSPRRSATQTSSDWYRTSFGKHTPWGDEESPAVVDCGRDGARTRCRRDDHEQRWPPDHPEVWMPARQSSSRVTRVASSSSCSTVSSPSKWTARRSPTSGPGAILGEARRCSRTAVGRRRCGP